MKDLQTHEPPPGLAATTTAISSAAVTTRRSFLARASLLGLGIPAFGTALAGCGGDEAEHAAEERPGAARARQGATATAVIPFQRYDPVLPPLGPGRSREIRLEARDATLAISSDAAMRAWTFNGTVPGPILHVRQGDSVRMTLTNRGTIAHSIDLHAARIDAETAFRSVAPGGSISYTFTPEYAGAFLYHCGTAPLLLHIGSGMYGAIIVDPPTPLPPAREFVLVHSGFYLAAGPGGEGGDGGDERAAAGSDVAGDAAAPGSGEQGIQVFAPSYQKMLSAFPDYVAFNGHTYQYRGAPIIVRRGERVRFYVVNAGPTDDCAFHVVGNIFDTVYLGAPPASSIQGVQTYSVPAGGGMIFELLADLPGTFPFVNHKFGHGDKGAAGVLIVEP